MDMNTSFLPAGFAGVISSIAIQRAAAVPVRKPRSGLLTAAQAALDAGRLPDLLVFASEVNYGYNRHSKALHDFAVAGDLEGLRAYPVNGVNTYGRALRRYRDLLVFHVERSAAEAVATAATNGTITVKPKTNVKAKKPPAKAKKIKAIKPQKDDLA